MTPTYLPFMTDNPTYHTPHSKVRLGQRVFKDELGTPLRTVLFTWKSLTDFDSDYSIHDDGVTTTSSFTLLASRADQYSSQYSSRNNQIPRHHASTAFTTHTNTSSTTSHSQKSCGFTNLRICRKELGSVCPQCASPDKYL